jgi:hypothetical protein
MLRTRSAFVALAAVGAACGGSAASNSAPSVDAGLHAEPPPVPSAPPATALAMITYAIRTVDFGETSGWQTLGFDIDGKDTTAASTDVCQLVGGAATSVQVDGVDGRDNSFGENFLPILHAVAGDNLAMILNKAIAGGGETDLLFVPVAAGSGDFTRAAGGLVNALALGHAPAWDDTDAWPVDSLSVQNESLSTPILAFPNGYITGGGWVSAPSIGSGTITVLGGGFYANRWPIADVTITIDHPGAETVNGTLSGVIPIWDLVGLILDGPQSDVCSSGDFSTAQGLINQLASSADILHDGTQDPTQPCDGMSIAFTFTASKATAGAVVPTMPPPTCVVPQSAR